MICLLVPFSAECCQWCSPIDTAYPGIAPRSLLVTRIFQNKIIPIAYYVLPMCQAEYSILYVIHIQLWKWYMKSDSCPHAGNEKLRRKVRSHASQAKDSPWGYAILVSGMKTLCSITQRHLQPLSTHIFMGLFSTLGKVQSFLLSLALGFCFP